jgi:hypothetical protein
MKFVLEILGFVCGSGMSEEKRIVRNCFPDNSSGFKKNKQKKNFYWSQSSYDSGIYNWSQSYDRELQRQRCKNLQRN